MKRLPRSARGPVAAMILAFLVSPAMLRADAARAPENRLCDFEVLDGYLDRRLEELNVPGAALAVVEGSEIVHFHGYGEARPGGELPSPSTPFVLGSLTKSFTALAVMQLVEEGKIDADAPVREYLPWFETADARSSGDMTVRHLLNQTSGLPMLAGMKHLANFDESPDACERRLAELRAFTPSRAPGEAFEYSDVNYNLLGLVIEAASGKRYGDAIEERIFAPLGMAHSHADFEEARRDGLAIGHTMRFGRTRPVPDLPRPTGSTPSGQLVSSAGDMALYLSAILRAGTAGGGFPLSPEGTAELLRPAAKAGSMGVDMGNYAMGWFVEETEGGQRLWHDGTVPDFFSYMALLPERDSGMILLVNANHMIANFSLLEMSEALTDMLAGRPVETMDQGGTIRMLRLFSVVPLLQVLGIAFTSGRIRRWKTDPDRRPRKAILLGIHILPASILHFLFAASAAAVPLAGMAGFMMLFMPDLTGLLFVCGGISFAWLVIRTPLILRATGGMKRSAGSRGEILPRRNPGDALEGVVEGSF